MMLHLRRALAFAVAAACVACSTGYRTPEDSEKLRGDLDDRTLESRVRIALASAPETRDEKIEVGCMDGTVYLRGLVRDPATKKRAHAIAAQVEGVRKVVDMFSDRPATD
ncbi:MAG: BON domain-containing protein [Planctomycetota bacterium]|jgi:osmotically-inducible protein OsmY